MLDKVKYTIESLLTSCSDINNMKSTLKGLYDTIVAYNTENKQRADMHSTFRVIEQYDTLFRVETNKFMAIPQANHYDRMYQVQEILSICSLLLSYIVAQLKKYNTEATDTRGTTAKALRQLVEARDFYKGEKMSWGGILKAETTIVNAKIDQIRLESSIVTDRDLVDN